MATLNINPPLSNVQEELLKLFNVNIPDVHLLELKSIMAKFLLEKARDKADEIWEEKGYSDELLKKILDGE